jgi:gliding motility-associated lipoprotein GldD
MKLIPILLICILTACGGNNITIPKPPSYLRLDLPETSYVTFEDACPYRFQLPAIYKVQKVKTQKDTPSTCHKDIDLGPLNGVIHFSYIDMIEPLSTYVNFANNKVDEHKLKASAIEDMRILNPDKNVFGTFFEIQGNVASPFQFYLTDSTDRFVSGVVYFNSKPNYDSLKPTLIYLKKDLMNMMETFEWK